MKSALFLSHDPRLQEVATEVLMARGAEVREAFVQLTETGEGRGMFNWEGPYGLALEPEFRDAPWQSADGVEPPDMATVDAYYVECRWEQQVAELARAIAQASEHPLWVLDDSNVVWDAAAIDPGRIHL